MGMYTEIVVKINIVRKQIGSNNFNILDYMFNPNTSCTLEDIIIPDDVFFKCSRWEDVGSMNSFYHHPNRVSDWYSPQFGTEDNVYIFARNDLKNYGSEIEKFFSWLNTLDLGYENDFIGYSLYEEDDIPVIYNKGIKND